MLSKQLLSGTLFLVFIYASSIKLKNCNNINITFVNEDNRLDKGLSYLPIIFLGYVIYKIFDFDDIFANYLITFQNSMDFLSLPLCILTCLIIFIQVLRCFKSNKQIITSMGDGDIWAMMGIVGFIPLGEFFIIIFLANITFILIYTTRRFLCS